MTDAVDKPQRAALARALYEEGLPVSEIAARTGLSMAMVYYWADRTVDADGNVARSPQKRRRAVARGLSPPDPKRRRSLVNRLWRAAERQVLQIEGRLDVLAGRPVEEGTAPDVPAVRSGNAPSARSSRADEIPAHGDRRGRRARKGKSDGTRPGPPLAPPDGEGAGAASARTPSEAPAPSRRAPAGDVEKDARALAVLARVLRELAALEDAEEKRNAPPEAGEEEAPRDVETFRRELARRLEALRQQGTD